MDHRPLWRLAFGFGAVVLVLLASGFLLLYAIRLEATLAGQSSAHQLIQMELIDKLQLDHAAVSELLYQSNDPVQGHASRHRSESERIRQEILSLAKEAKVQNLTATEMAAWAEVVNSAAMLLDAADASVAGQAVPAARIATNHGRFIASVARLLDTSYQDARGRQEEEMRRFARYFDASATLLGCAVVLAIAGTIGSILFTFRLFRKVEHQASALRALALHVLEEQEKSARRFSQELHDEFGQTLNAIDTTLSSIRPDSLAGTAQMAEVRVMVKEAIANAREMARLLRPSILDDFGLDASLRELAQGFSQRTGIVVNYNSSLRERLAPEVETHLYRIAQEALTNVSRHSSARQVSIDLTAKETSLRFCISDDGGGMADPKSPHRRSLGLIGMAERANAAGGRIAIHNQPGKGVEIVVEAPLARKNT